MLSSEGNTLFYVTAKLHSKYFFLLGPLDTHQEALDKVDEVKDYCWKYTFMGPFLAYGTASRHKNDKFIIGRLNHIFVK